MVGLPKNLLVNTSKSDNEIMATTNQLKILPLHSEIASMQLTSTLIFLTRDLRLRKLPEGITVFWEFLWKLHHFMEKCNSFKPITHLGVMGFSMYSVPDFQNSCASILFRTALSSFMTSLYTPCFLARASSFE